MNQYLNLKSPFFYLPVFLFFFIHIVLRAIYVNPFCDEIGTFFDYIETGNIWEAKPNLSSANNHLLVTFIGRFFYNLFGNNMFCFRMISVLSFVLYFFSALKIVDKSIESKFKILVFLGLLSIAWMNDFFSYARGYAFSLGAYFLSIYLLILWKRELKIIHLLFMLLLQYFSVFANLSYLNSSIVFLSLLVVLLIFQKGLLKKRLISLLFIMLYIIALIPLINYVFELKDAGSLWWGTKIGWWDSCVLQLIDLTFFTKNGPIYLISIFLGIILVVYILYMLKKYGVKFLITDEKGIIIYILAGHICLTQLLVSFFEVNYPSDRVAMIYVPLILLLMAFIIDTFKKIQWLFLCFLFFPISFLIQMNLSTSVYMGHTRVSEKSFREIIYRLRKTRSFGMDGLSYRNYIYRMREEPKVVIANVQQDVQPPVNCQLIYISDVNDFWKATKNHRLVYSEVATNARLYELKTPFVKKCTFDTLIDISASESEFIGLIPEKRPDAISKTNQYQLFMEGELIFKKKPTNYTLVYSNSDDRKVNKVYQSINFSNYCVTDKPLKFEWTSPIYDKTSSSDKFVLYFWNRDSIQCTLKNVGVKIYSLDEKRK